VPDIDQEFIHFCHGAPGFVVSLVAIRTYFPILQPRIDVAIKRGRKLIWERGLLTKEPNICHGITGNALALTAPKRDHFLALATPDHIKKGIEDGTFKRGDDAYGMLWGLAGRAWVWMNTMDGKDRGVVLYTDV